MYFSGFPTFWNEKGLMLSTMALVSISYVIKVHEESHISPFLMNLRPEFETVRVALMNLEASPDLYTCIQEVLWKDIQLQSQHTLAEEPRVFMTFHSEDMALIIAWGQKVQCFEHEGYGHVAHHSDKLLQLL